MNVYRLMPDDDRRSVTRLLIVLAGIILIFLALAIGSLRPAKAEQFLPHPKGCPKALFCGCGAAVDVFGKPIRSLWLARNWFQFPRTRPAPGMVAVRKGHVFVLARHVKGNVWVARDYNSGGRKSRLHRRSLAGYVIVDPHATNMAGL